MSRQQIIQQYFTNIAPVRQYIDIYAVRKAIFESLENNISKFSGVLLDVGCGIMPYREIILERNNHVEKYIGLDFESSLDEEYALGKPDLFWKGDIIPLEDNSVDTVLATELFEHCPNPEAIMHEIIRVLKPNGVLFLTVPFVWNLHLVPYDEYRYTPFSLKRHLSNAGFTDIQLTALGGWDASLAQMLGIWFQNRPMKGRYKRLLAYPVIKIIQRLLKMDTSFDKSHFEKDGVMITGISGTAYKR